MVWNIVNRYCTGSSRYPYRYNFTSLGGVRWWSRASLAEVVKRQSCESTIFNRKAGPMLQCFELQRRVRVLPSRQDSEKSIDDGPRQSLKRLCSFWRWAALNQNQNGSPVAFSCFLVFSGQNHWSLDPSVSLSMINDRPIGRNFCKLSSSSRYVSLSNDWQPICVVHRPIDMQSLEWYSMRPSSAIGNYIWCSRA
ncbi:hypothetical protein MRB53_027486 [Persea americana]|uniref:Uncharacterized protein n=1 Tax=Persea americana TaxID=3435 RepID=A0ACC2LL99_PERAE|nr:hypothetical protein MRB53_027486 [Persea americana]